LEIEVEYITDIQKIVEMGVMSSPAFTGFVPNIERIKEAIKNYI